MVVRVICFHEETEIGVVSVHSMDELMESLRQLVFPRKVLQAMLPHLQEDGPFELSGEALCICSLSDIEPPQCCICFEKGTSQMLQCDGGRHEGEKVGGECHSVCGPCLEQFCRVSSGSLEQIGPRHLSCPGRQRCCLNLATVFKHVSEETVQTLMTTVQRRAQEGLRLSLSRMPLPPSSSNGLTDLKKRVEIALNLGALVWVCPTCGSTGLKVVDDCFHIRCFHCNNHSCWACSRLRTPGPESCGGCDTPCPWLTGHDGFESRNSETATAIFQAMLKRFYVEEVRRRLGNEDVWKEFLEQFPEMLHGLPPASEGHGLPLLGPLRSQSTREVQWRRRMLEDALMKEGLSWEAACTPISPAGTDTSSVADVETISWAAASSVGVAGAAEAAVPADATLNIRAARVDSFTGAASSDAPPPAGAARGAPGMIGAHDASGNSLRHDSRSRSRSRGPADSPTIPRRSSCRAGSATISRPSSYGPGSATGRSPSRRADGRAREGRSAGPGFSRRGDADERGRQRRRMRQGATLQSSDERAHRCRRRRSYRSSGGKSGHHRHEYYIGRDRDRDRANRRRRFRRREDRGNARADVPDHRAHAHGSS